MKQFVSPKMGTLIPSFYETTTLAETVIISRPPYVRCKIRLAVQSLWVVTQTAEQTMHLPSSCQSTNNPFSFYVHHHSVLLLDGTQGHFTYLSPTRKLALLLRLAKVLSCTLRHFLTSEALFN